METRFARVPRRSASLEGLSRYLPENYSVVLTSEDWFIIAGRDVAGWTLDGYVIPRLASGLIFAEEVNGVSA